MTIDIEKVFLETYLVKTVIEILGTVTITPLLHSNDV